jgi:hypothetical protein
MAKAEKLAQPLETNEIAWRPGKRQDFTHGAAVAGLGQVQGYHRTRSCPTPGIYYDDEFVLVNINAPSRKIVRYKPFFRRSTSSSPGRNLTLLL